MERDLEIEENQTNNELLKSQIAIRCAKAALLLSSLKSTPPNHNKTRIDKEVKQTNKQSLNRSLWNRRRTLLFHLLMSGKGATIERGSGSEGGTGEGEVQEQAHEALQRV